MGELEEDAEADTVDAEADELHLAGPIRNCAEWSSHTVMVAVRLAHSALNDGHQHRANDKHHVRSKSDHASRHGKRKLSMTSTQLVHAMPTASDAEVGGASQSQTHSNRPGNSNSQKPAPSDDTGRTRPSARESYTLIMGVQSATSGNYRKVKKTLAQKSRTASMQINLGNRSDREGDVLTQR